MMKVLKKIMFVLLLVVAVVFLGGIGSIIIDHFILPKFAASPALSRYSFLRRATENTTIINKTEQVIVREDDSVEKIASQATTAVVNIVSVSTDEKNVKPIDTSIPTQVLTGSGALVTNDGLIVTYRKAIFEKNATYTVLLFNGSSYPAELVGIDSLTNLAFLKIQASNVPAISFADSDDTRPGKKLIALANSSEEYRNRFSTALLSDINKTFNLSEKTVASSEKWEGVFEMDFSNQQDYLGGPVIDFNGELVGLVASTEFDNQKQYFLLPSNVIKASLELAIHGDIDKRPSLGLYYLPITKEMSLAYHVSRDRGALVFSSSGKSSLAVIAGSPADKAHLHVNDIIIAVNGKEINLDNPLSVVIGQFKKGDTVELLVLHDKEEKRVKVELH